MSKFLLTVCAFGLLLSSAFAEEKSPEQHREESNQIRLQKIDWGTRIVASGTNQRIGFFYAVNPDCSASGDINIRVTKQPEHGTAEIVAATSFPNFARENIRYRCNRHKVRGQQVNYKSAEKYIGTDTLELLVLFPGGFAREVHVNIDVRWTGQTTFCARLDDNWNLIVVVRPATTSSAAAVEFGFQISNTLLIWVLALAMGLRIAGRQ